VQFGETAVAKDTDRYRMKLRSYSGRLVRLVKTVGKDPNCVLFVTVEIRTRWQLVFRLDSGDRLLLDLEVKGQGKCRIVREDVEVWWSVIVLTLLTEGIDIETYLMR